MVLMNEGGTVTSATAVLTVAASCTAPVITLQPQSQLACTGATATFTVTATGPRPLSYQWRKDGNNLSNGGNISGADSSTLTIQPVSTSDRASYDVVVGNPAGSVTSQPAACGCTSPALTPTATACPTTLMQILTTLTPRLRIL